MIKEATEQISRILESVRVERLRQGSFPVPLRLTERPQNQLHGVASVGRWDATLGRWFQVDGCYVASYEVTVQ